MLARLMIGILFLSLMGCESRTRSSNSNATPSQPTLPSLAPGEKPKAILDLPKPVESKQVNGRDVSEESPDVLQAAARQAIAAGRHADATILQYWACQQLDQEYYNLACYSALASKTDAAFYWLQQAGLTEGFDLEWAERDADLVRVRADPRWPTFVPWLGQCQAYWNVAGSAYHHGGPAGKLQSGRRTRTHCDHLAAWHGFGAFRVGQPR